ncbi:hypothetical protein LX36DRAFT_499369 [Colletotrichum falcatum]|nr:hypothetical protein LX36DRAFT_499369 [Colletotrichum falcatum]
MCGRASSMSRKRDISPPGTPSQPSTKRVKLSSAAAEPVFERLEVTADMNSEDIIRISRRRRGDNRPIVNHRSDDTFAILGVREQAHIMLDKILRHSDNPTFTCIARLVSDTEKAAPSISTPAVACGVTQGVLHNGIGETMAVPAPELNGPVISRHSLDAALKKWSAWGKPDIKLRLLVDEMEDLEPQARFVELLVIRKYAAKNSEMFVLCFDPMFSLGPDDLTFPWDRLKPSNMVGGPDRSYESFLQEIK